MQWLIFTERCNCIILGGYRKYSALLNFSDNITVSMLFQVTLSIDNRDLVTHKIDLIDEKSVNIYEIYIYICKLHKLYVRVTANFRVIYCLFEKRMVLSGFALIIGC